MQYLSREDHRQSQGFISSTLIVSSKTFDFLWRDPKCGVLHAQGLEDPLLQKVFNFAQRSPQPAPQTSANEYSHLVPGS